jgi:phosphate transport system protein
MWRLLLEMVDLAERTVSASLSAIAEASIIDAQVRVWSDELLVKYDAVEDKAVELIARFQPVASDLRVIKSSMKIGYDLVRLGRYAYDIVQILDLLEGGKDADRKFLESMSSKTLDVLKLSFEALKTRDAKLAMKVVEMDTDIDCLYRAYIKKVSSNPSLKVTEAVSTALIARHLERIADHAWYMAEAVRYMVIGR